jgi:hypothetical protein
MKKNVQVPGDQNRQNQHTPHSPPLNAEEQMLYLRERLAGHRAFAACRGQFHDLPYTEFLERVKRHGVEGALKPFDKWCGTRRIMLKMLAQLTRDGNMVAAYELEQALTSEHIMTGETIPSEKTKPGVLVMFDPQKTLLVTRWFYTTQVEDARQYARTGQNDLKRGQCGFLSPRLFELFPHLKQELLADSRDWFEKVALELRPRINDDCIKFNQVFGENDIAGMFLDQSRCEWWHGYNTLALFVHNATQDKVLGMFTRTEQASIATWQFNYPRFERSNMSCMWSHFPNFWVGFHPEDEHAAWSKCWPSYVSRGCAAGLGAVIVDKEKLGEGSTTRPYGHPPYKVLRWAHPNPLKEAGDLMRARFVLGFPYGD